MRRLWVDFEKGAILGKCTPHGIHCARAGAVKIPSECKQCKIGDKGTLQLLD